MVARMKLSDWGADPGAITASPTAALTYDKPAVSTYAPDTGWSAPSGNTAAPYANMPAVGSQQAWQGPATGWAAPAAQAAPAGPPPPAAGGAREYASLDAGDQAAAQQNFLGGDSDYTAQLGEYDRALQDFITRIGDQKKGFQLDTDNAVAANTKNRDLSGNQLGEDFGARGLSYSGLFDKSKNLMYDRYGEQEKNINQVGTKNLTDADNRQSDFQAQNNIDRGNAKRAALGRMAQQQALIDSQQVF